MQQIALTFRNLTTSFSETKTLIFATTLLLSLGVIMVYSSSAIFADQTLHDSTYFLKRQLVFLALGLFAFYFATQIRTETYRLFAYPIYLLVIFLLVLVLVPGIGKNAGGSARWIAIGSFQLQAGEILKFALIAYLAMSLDKKREKMSVFRIGIVPHLVLPGIAMILLMLEPDLGTTFMVACVTFVMLFAGGARVLYLLGGLLLCIPILWVAILTSPYRLTRVIAFLDPWTHRSDAGYQVVESLITFGSGGLTGAGIGLGKGKLFYLPAAHTDFILAVIGEELGFIGVSVILFCFFMIAVSGFRVAARLRKPFQSYLAIGISTMLTLQATFNVFVVLGLAPTKGITLPFISYGGSSLLMSCFMMGVLIRLSRVKQEELGTT